MESKEKSDALLGRDGKFCKLIEIFNFTVPTANHWIKIGQSDQPDTEIKRTYNSPRILALPPSEYMKQLLMTTDERIELLTKIRPLGNQEVHNDLIEYNEFEIVPRVLLFQQYTPGNIYNVLLTIRNTGKTSRYLKLTCEIDPTFCVTCKGTSTSNTRLAPGIFNTYNVRFSPNENRDYEYKIRILTGRETLDIPVLAVGPRAILDFPDHVVVPETAVKIPAIKTLLVRNLGNSVAVFNTSTSSSHFWLEPSEGIVEEEETVQFVVNFLSSKAGFFEDSILLTYESGEMIRIRVQGSAIDSNVRLERGSVRIHGETYIGMSASKTLKIFNRSEHIVKYRWMKYEDSETDNTLKQKYERIFGLIHDAEVARCMDLVHYNVSVPETHELVCQRIYADEISSLVNENFLYKNRHFSLKPIEGEIWSQGSVDVTVVFEPDEIGELSSTGYLEVTGREGRLALSLSGMSIGPLIKLDLSTTDLPNIFLCSVHNFQVVCTNKGIIPGVLVYRPKRSDFGGNITVTPQKINLQPGQYKSFDVSFSSNRTGDFVERVDFVVKESLEVIATYIKGCVVCPTLRFDKTRLDFGAVALGFTAKQDVTLHNDSSVPVTFSISVPNDGTETAMAVEDFARDPTKPLFPSSPREFLIIPKEGLLGPNSSLLIRISFTPNLARSGEMSLQVDMWDTNSLPINLPIIFRTKVATLVVTPDEIDIGSAFLNFPYSRILNVQNKSDVNGYYYFIPKTITDSKTMLYSLSTYGGYLGPGCSTLVTFTVTTRTMGKQKIVMSMLTLGEKSVRACCVLTCNGEGPVVSIQPTKLNWTNVLLLREQPMLLTLANCSPVPTEFTASLSRKNSAWEILPTSGELHPGEPMLLEVTAFLRDVGKQTDKILITIPNCRTIAVPLYAIGIGSCVICEPPIFPTFDMGTLFSNQDIGLPIEVTNHGSRHLRLVFLNSMELKMLRGQIKTPKYNKFFVDPMSIDLPARSTVKVTCNVRSDVCETVTEQWWLHCFYNAQGKREILGNSNFIAKFVEPSVTFSKKELSFVVNMSTEANKSRQTNEFLITNTSGRNLNANLTIDQPFGILTDRGDEVQTLEIFLPEHEPRCVVVFFSTMKENGKRYSEEYIGTLKLEYNEHPHADKIKCRANLNYPNVSSLPKEIRLNCPIGCSALENIYIKNNGPLEVSYKFVWLDETIAIKRESKEVQSVELKEKLDQLGITSGNKDHSKCTEYLPKTKKILMNSLSDNLVVEERELEALEILGNEARVVNEINQIYSIVPCETILPPYSTQCISFGFHGTEALMFEARVMCEIKGGPAELIKVFALSDEIRFRLDKERVDFGQQAIFESSLAAIKLKNCGEIELIYHIESVESSDESLTIQPMSAKIAAHSTIDIELISRTVIPGRFEKSFKLCIEHCMPISIIVQGMATVPQVYVALPRSNFFKINSVELGYKAIRSLQNSFNFYDDMEEIENGWLLVMKDGRIPSLIDIEMVVESLIAKEFITENYLCLIERIRRPNVDSAVPYLFSPEYILEMGCVVVGQKVQASTNVYNYGSRSARIRLNKSGTTDNLAKRGIHIAFRHETILMPGEYANLEVTLNPTKLKTSETFSDIKHTFYLEVTNGFTLPIMISAKVTYPFITVNPKVLEFGDVSIGECKLMNLIIKNDGLIDCQWDAQLPPIKRNELDGPFLLQNITDIYRPGQSGSIKIFFKPRKSCYAESRLTVGINRGLEPITVDLRGRGIDNKLKILPHSIQFSPVLPYDISQGKIFSVENIGQRTLELYWPHLRLPTLQEDRIIRVLTHYYQVDEILLPPRRPPDSSKLPTQLFDFYNSLVDEMTLSRVSQRNLDRRLTNEKPTEKYTVDKRVVEEDTRSIDTTQRERKAPSARKLSKKLTRTASYVAAMSETNLSLSVLSEHARLESQSSLLYDDPDEVETLLHSFIDDLQKQPGFHEKMKDPVKEVFDASKKKSLPKMEQVGEVPIPRIKQIGMIFHGPPFTEYETAACKASRVLRLPLLNVNDIITEMIAIGNTTCSDTLREIIDNKYQDLLLASEHFLSADEPKTFGPEELLPLDSMTRYKYKIESIKSSLEKVRKGSATESAKSSKSPRVKTEETFLGIDIQLLGELLEQRLSMPDTDKGFILQSLNNRFIASEANTLTLLLRYLGNIEFPIFVLFHDSVDCTHGIRNKMEEGKPLEESCQRLTEIDKMSSFEFDTLPSADLDSYREKILIPRNEIASRRRMQFRQRISERRKYGRVQRPNDVSTEYNKEFEPRENSKSVVSRSGQANEKALQELSDKNLNTQAKNAENSAQQTVPMGMDTVVDKKANLDFETMLAILEKWDPSRQGNISHQKGISHIKISKNPKNKDRPATAAGKTETQVYDKFWIWHVKMTDPYNLKHCDMIVSLSESLATILNARPNTVLSEEGQDLNPQVYSVVTRTVRAVPQSHSSASQKRAFDLFSLKYNTVDNYNESADRLETSELIEEPITERLVLEPHESRIFKIHFNPKKADVFYDEFPIGIFNSSDLSYCIKVTGSSDIPRLNMDPSCVFKKIKKTKKDELNDPTFFTDTQTFDFGSLLFTTKDNKSHRKKTTLKFWNASKINVELEASLMASNWKTFNIEPTQLLIKPEEFGVIDVTAGATKLGPNEERLVLLVKNNPRVEVIALRSNGTELDVELEGKQISFGKILLYREFNRYLKVRNKSNIPIFWTITPVDSIDSQLKLSSSTGITAAQNESTIVFSYKANRIGTMNSAKMNVKVHLNEETAYEESLFTDTVTITGETYDVAVDIKSANPINLGSARVGTMTSATFTIENRGPYDVKFVIEFEKSEKLPLEIDRNTQKNLRENLQISPFLGTIASDKVAAINVNYLPKLEIHLNEAPLLKCNLIDTENDATIVAEFPLSVSISAHYSRFHLIPHSEINFGSTSIYHNKTLQLAIENVGVFPFQYYLKNPLLPIVTEEALKKKIKEKSPRSATTNKQETSKSRNAAPSLRIGPFTLTKAEGIIKPGDTETIAIDCYPETEGRLEEQILVEVEHDTPENTCGRNFLLSVDSCLPNIDFHDFDFIFQDSYVVGDLQDFNCPKEVESHTIFSCNEKCLYFRRVIIHQTHTASVRLYNRGSVPARVTIRLRPDFLTPKNAKPDTFALDIVQESIAPMSSQLFSISFTPSLIETYNGILEAAVELPAHLKNEPQNKLSITLSGEGCVPEVVLIEPPIVKRGENSTIGFGKCLIEETSTKNLCLKNIGQTTAKVIVKVIHDPNKLYTIRLSPESRLRSETVIWNESEAIGYEEEECSAACTLSTDQVVQFFVDFRPRELGIKKAEMRVLVFDNPYDNVSVGLEGEGFVENVVVEGLPLVETPSSVINDGIDGKARKSMKRHMSTAASLAGSSTTIASKNFFGAPALIYELDYGTCFVKKMKKINFQLVNKSGECNFRFEWPLHENLIFVPSSGHLRYFESKDVVATFLAPETTIYEKVPIECVFSEIEFPTEHKLENPWDDRQSNVEWVEIDREDGKENIFNGTMKKIIVPASEPAHEIVPGTTRTIRLMLSAIVAYSDYFCALKEINFRDTLMFQSCEYTFNLENPGNVDLIYNWKIDMDAEYPTRLSDSVLHAIALKLRSTRSNDSRPSSRSSGGILYPEPEKYSNDYGPSRNQRGDELISYFRSVTRDKFKSLELDPSDCPCPPTSDLFSNSATHTQRTTESWIENTDNQPFSIKPERGVILPGKSIDFTIRFSPLDVFDYKAYLACQIENLRPNTEQLTIPLMGRSLLPYCHFDVEESDYLSGRRDSNLGLPYLGSGDSGNLTDHFTTPRVLELKIVGIGESHMKQFYLVNPTTENFRFTWKDLTPREPDDLPYFHCAHEEGLVESGKRTSIVFTFYAEDLGTFESFWRFSVDRHKLETIFLLVAIVNEPTVKCSTAKLKMKPTSLGSKVEDSIIVTNAENFQLPFKVLPDSLCSKEGSLQKLVVSPMSGILKAKCEQVLHISFEPNRVGDSTFLLRCQVQKMKNPLSTLIRARATQIISRVSYNADFKAQMHEIHDDCETLLDFGKVSLNKPSSIKFEIANIGDVMFRYTWDLGTQDCGTYTLTISEIAESVDSESKAICYLQLMALKKTVIRRHPVVLKINNGPVYRMLVRASAKRPSVEFSFIKHDFGPCYIRNDNFPAYMTELLVTNNDKTPAIVECNFVENLPHMIVNLEALSQGIASHSTVSIPIYFRPQDQVRYHEKLLFFVNCSTVQQPVNLKGEGIPYKISLENLRDKSIEFGNVLPGQTIIRKVRIINAGRAAVELRFDLVKSLPGYGDHRSRANRSREQSLLRSKIRSPEFQKFNDDKRQNETFAMFREVLEIQPRDIILQANKSIELVLTFKPTKRMSTFVEKVGAQVDSTILPLFFVRGSCLDREFRLDRTHLFFGTVVDGCSAETKLVLHNSGDFGARFKWNVAKLKPHFDLSPVSGYCSPGMDVTFTVTFHPAQPGSILETEATIAIEKHSSMRVSCSGTCCKIPDSIEALHFLVPVRSAQTKNITITNDTNFAWNVHAVLTGEYFHIEKSFIVPDNKSSSRGVTYAPLVMNNAENPHRGRLLVKLPENKPPLVYNLVGVSNPPEVLGKISRQLPAKTKYTELLPVPNWLNKSQTFRCDIKIIGDLKVIPVLYSFTGPNRLDVPPIDSRDFRASFYCYNEAILNFRITFTNDDNEYQFYEVEYKVSKPEVLSTIKLTTAVRSSICYYLQIENPLEDRSVTFTANWENPDIIIQGIPKIVSAKASDKITIEFSPFICGESVAKLDINCPELGNFPYELRLKATPAAPEKVTRVTAMLGSSTTFPIVINNVSKKNAEIAIEFDDPSFESSKTISMAPGKKTTLKVTYEPCDAKNVRAMMRANSKSLGEMLFPLIGSYTLPKPQGPFTVSRNSSVSIDFKNVFKVTKTFEYLVDGDAFSIATSTEAIRPKQTATIVVKFRSTNETEESDGNKHPVTGKLIVSCDGPNDSQIVWVYYLRGIID